MKTRRHITWENFRSTIIVPGEQRVHRVSESPLMEIFSDGLSNRIGIWIQTGAKTEIPEELLKLSSISVRIAEQHRLPVLEVATSSRDLQRHFYHFAVAVAEKVLLDKSPAVEAVLSEVQCFGAILEKKSLLSVERQIGLLGELLLLERLITKNGPAALAAWIGPEGEPHDFRIEKREFEAKTTVTVHRIHTINGSEQLAPSKDCSLYLVSILLGPAGKSEGFSLPDKVRNLSALLANAPREIERFSAALEKSSLRLEDYVHYGRRYALRRPFAIVPVDRKFPALTRPVIQKALGEASTRVESLQYSVNVEGLETEESLSGFSSILPV
jgi:Putative  PD-(D/E)XK family member, (DUF4420)